MIPQKAGYLKIEWQIGSQIYIMSRLIYQQFMGDYDDTRIKNYYNNGYLNKFNFNNYLYNSDSYSRKWVKIWIKTLKQLYMQ